MSQAIPGAILGQHLAILGKTGRGKSTTAKVCVKQVHEEDYRVCILDTLKSDWWGLTSSADGKRPGLPFHILGGPHAHLPLSSSSGKAIAELVARGQLKHTIIDMAEFEPGGQMRFFVDFAPKLLQRMKGVLYLVIEEAHILAPKERAGIGYENMSVHWAKTLATAGRSKGIRLIILSQRTQAVHNAVLGSCDSMIVHGMTAPADMEPVTKWLKANSKNKTLNLEIEGSLSGLPAGEAWVCSSEAGIFERVQMPLSGTFDNTATPTDDDELHAVKSAPVDLEKLRTLLGKAAADAEANDPKVLQKRIATLEAELAKKPAPMVDERTITVLRDEGFEEGYKSALIGCREAGLVEFNQIVQHVQDARGRFDNLLSAAKPPMLRKPAKRVGNPLVTAKEATKLIADSIERATDPQPFSRKSAFAVPENESADLRKPTGLPLEVLRALRWFEERGMRPAPRGAVGTMVKKTLDQGYGARVLGEMKTSGLITYPVPGTLEMTPDKGAPLAPDLPLYKSRYDAWMDFLGGLHREVVDRLANEHPAAMSRESMGRLVGKNLSVGYGARVLGELKTLGAITYPNPGYLALTPYVMP